MTTQTDLQTRTTIYSGVFDRSNAPSVPLTAVNCTFRVISDRFFVLGVYQNSSTYTYDINTYCGTLISESTPVTRTTKGVISNTTAQQGGTINAVVPFSDYRYEATLTFHSSSGSLPHMYRITLQNCSTDENLNFLCIEQLF